MPAFQSLKPGLWRSVSRCPRPAQYIKLTRLSGAHNSTCYHYQTSGSCTYSARLYTQRRGQAKVRSRKGHVSMPWLVACDAQQQFPMRSIVLWAPSCFLHEQHAANTPLCFLLDAHQRIVVKQTVLLPLHAGLLTPSFSTFPRYQTSECS